MQAAAAVFRAAGVVRIYCTHGTFAGNDALGLLTEFTRVAPALSKRLRRFCKGAVDMVLGDLSNFSAGYCRRFNSAAIAADAAPIEMQRFHWSGQNNHVGRADGAVLLIDELRSLAESLTDSQIDAAASGRVQLWGHSHGGNVFALVTNLLGADPQTRERFFDTAETFFERRLSRGSDMPAWPRVRAALGDPSHPLRRLKFDIVTLGAPIRYGWDAGGYDNLLHFVNHRPLSDAPEYLAPFPPSPGRIFRGAMRGDFVQHLGIAGTNFFPNPLAFRTMAADWRLHQLVQKQTLPSEFILKRLNKRSRVPDEGETLLVDYYDSTWKSLRNVLGHGVYTRLTWMPFHLEQIAKRFYQHHLEPAIGESRNA